MAYPDYQQMNMWQYQPNYQQPKRIFASVQGEAAADVYPVMAGQEVILFDEDNPYVYSKCRDMNNVLTKKRFKLIEDTEPPKKEISLDGYVKTEDLPNLIAKAVKDEVDRQMSEISFTTKPKRTKGGEV